jgi:hypothetical protein
MLLLYCDSLKHDEYYIDGSGDWANFLTQNILIDELSNGYKILKFENSKIMRMFRDYISKKDTEFYSFTRSYHDCL